MFTCAACAATAAASSAPTRVQDWPEDVGYIAVYSKHDGIVDWRACLDPCADEHVEVGASHCGMAVHPDVYARSSAVARRASPTADDTPVWTEWAQAA